MEADKPVQPSEAPKPMARSSARCVCVALTLVFALIFAASWWLTPIEPYATLKSEEGACAVFSLDGSWIVTWGMRAGGSLQVWDVAGGCERFSIRLGRKQIESVDFSPNSKLLAFHEKEGDIEIWDTTTGTEIANIRPKTRFENGQSFRFSPDGRFLFFQVHRKTLTDKDNITFWKIESQKELGTVEGDFETLAFSPDGHTFATFRRKDNRKTSEVLLWKLDQAPVLMKQHQINADVGAFSPDLMSFAAANDLPNGNGEVFMADIATGKKRWSLTFNQHGTHVQTLSFEANGKILAAHGSETPADDILTPKRTTLWHVASVPKEIGSFSETPAVSSDGEWLAIPLASGAKLVRVSALDQGTDLVVNGDSGEVHLITPSISPDSKMLFVSGLYRQGQEPLQRKWLPGKFNPFRGQPGGPVVRVWDVDACREVTAFNGCNKAWFSPDGKGLATFRFRGGVNMLWDVDFWPVPLRISPWRVFGCAVFVWSAIILVGWLGLKTRQKLLSR